MRRFEPSELPEEVEGAIQDISARVGAVSADKVSPTQYPAPLLLQRMTRACSHRILAAVHCPSHLHVLGLSILHST